MLYNEAYVIERCLWNTAVQMNKHMLKKKKERNRRRQNRGISATVKRMCN